MTQALIFIINAVANIVLLLFLLRFWMPLLRVDFRNPLAQAILRITSPVIVPLRRLLPPIGRVDTATVLVLLVLQTVSLLLVYALLSHSSPSPAAVAVTVVIELAVQSLYLFFFVVLISVILSWIAPHNYNPVTSMVNAMAEPVLRPFRRIVPDLGGIDISPVFALILLQAAVILLRSL